MSLRLVPKALHYADEVARSGSIQSAARVLNISASAIDRQILMLEDHLGVPLFERQASGMRLSPAGEMLVALARRWRSDAQRLVSEIRQMQGVHQGHLHMAAMDSHANGFLPAFVERLAREHPRVRLEVDIVSTDAAEQALTAGEIDLAAAFNLRASRDIHLVWSEELPLGCVVSPAHPLATEASLTLKQVAAHPIVLQSRALMIRRYLESRHAWLFTDGDPPVATNSLQLLKRLVVAGTHVALTSELDAAPEILDGSLCFIPVRGANVSPQSVAVAVSARRPLPKIARMVADILADEMRAALTAVRARGRTPHGAPRARQ